MKIHIDRNGERFGPYSIEEINAYLANGTLLPSDLAWKDGMTTWLPVQQISGVVVATGSVATSVLPSQTVSIGNKKILQGIAAVVGLLAIGAGIWVFFFRATEEKKQFANNDEGNIPIAESVEETAKETADKASRIDTIIQLDLTKHGLKPNPPASDVEFVRRLYLDVIGRIPTGDELKRFTQTLVKTVGLG